MIVLIKDRVLANNIKSANSFLKKLIGLIGKRHLEKNEGLMLFNWSSIHGLFMNFEMDVVYLSKDMQVIGIETLKPWKVGKIFKDTKHVLQLPAGSTIGKIVVGDFLSIKHE